MSWILDSEVLAVLAAVTIVSAVFTGVQIFNIGRVVEPFSELGLLGPEGKIGDYPRQVVAGSPFRLNVYVGNHEGKTMYYRVLVKLGSDASIINETVSLSVEPIMEVRVVLMHNTSHIIPINITLYEPATCIRVIFEMWIFNESVGVFTYHGRWNQLWLNVTGVPVEGESQQRKSLVLNEEMERKLVEGYLAIRRAEKAGGAVAEMVGLLNNAVNLALTGHEGEAETLVEQVIAMEHEVSRLGLEAERIRLYTSIGISTGVCIIGVGAFLFLRRRVWSYWARFYKGWLVTWKGDGSKLNNVEKTLKDYIKSNGRVSVENIISNRGASLGSHEVAKALYKLVRRGAVKLVDPKPPASFTQFFFSRHNLGFALATAITALCLLSVFLSNLATFLAGLRVVLGSVFTLFLPGCALIEALYPDERELSPLERLALSIGLSLAIVPLVGLVLNYTPWGIRLNPTLAALSALSLGLMFVSAYRKFHILTLKVSIRG